MSMPTEVVSDSKEGKHESHSMISLALFCPLYIHFGEREKKTSEEDASVACCHCFCTHSIYAIIIIASIGSTVTNQHESTDFIIIHM